MSIFKNISKIVIIALLILMIPFLGMQFSNEVNWSLSDFVIAGVFLIVFGLVIDNLWRMISTPSYRLLTVGATILIFALIWIELAVGIFGSPLAGN